MDETVKAFSIYQAYQTLLRSEGIEKPESKQFVNLDLVEADFDTVINLFKGSGVVVGYTVHPPEENPNLTQTQVIDTKNPPGDKKWKSKYLAVYDTPFGDQVVPDSNSEIKKTCVDAARAAGSEEKRDTFVIIGKSPNGFPRCQAQILYKASPKQEMGTYYFSW